MSALEADVSFDFTSPSPCTPPPAGRANLILDNGTFFPSFDPSLLNIPRYIKRHVRSSSNASSVYSAPSTVESTPETTYTRLSTPPRASPPVRHHGPLLLPKIRPQDQVIGQDYQLASSAFSNPRKSRTSKSPQPSSRARKTSRHTRSFTSPNVLVGLNTFSHMTPFSPSPPEYLSRSSFTDQPEALDTAPLLCSPAPFSLFAAHADVPQNAPCESRSSRSSSICEFDTSTLDYNLATYHPIPYMTTPSGLPSESLLAAPGSRTSLMPSAWNPQNPSLETFSVCPLPNELSTTPETTTLLDFLNGPNPAASLVRNISLPLRDPSIKHFWWDIRSIRSWTSFNAAAVLALPGASALLTTPVPAPLLPQPSMRSRHPETETALHAIYASFYLPKLNAALSISSSRPMRFTVPSKGIQGMNDLLFVANPDNESAAATLFGGKPTARVVGLVRSFDRFNTGMRVEGNIKRVEYLRGLAALHYAMREHSCRYGFILTEIELVLVRCGTEATPFFGDLDITSVQLAAADPGDEDDSTPLVETPLTACFALWGLCQLAGDSAPYGHAPWKADIGAPAEGTRRKARPRESWMPQPQLTEKREAKRSRGWVWPEDPVGRKEIGKRGVRYNSM